MKYTFELRKEKENKDGLIPIRLVVTNEKIRIRKSIDVKCRIEDWDYSTTQIYNPQKNNKRYSLYKKYNQNLIDVKNRVDTIFEFFRYNDIPFSEETFNEKYESANPKVTIRFFEAFDEYIEYSKLVKTSSTVTKIKSIKNFLVDFENTTNFKLKLDLIDFRFEDLFMDYCYNTKETLNNYYAKIIKNIKAFMNWAYQRGYHKSLEFKKLKCKEDDIEVIYLTPNELMKLYKHKFKDSNLERVKDMWCFLAFTGQRHSDIYSLKNANVKEDYLNFTVTKGKTVDHQVYLIKQAKELIEKYENTIYYPIPRISNQKLNSEIKKCCEEVDLIEEIELTRFIGAKRISQIFRKCDIISSHSGRKTFITNSLFLGVPERIVRLTTNHKSERSFRKYVHTSELHLQKELSKWNNLSN